MGFRGSRVRIPASRPTFPNEFAMREGFGEGSRSLSSPARLPRELAHSAPRLLTASDSRRAPTPSQPPERAPDPCQPRRRRIRPMAATPEEAGRLQADLAAHERVLQDFTASAQKIPSSAWNLPMRAGKWSPAQVAEHLRL